MRRSPAPSALANQSPPAPPRHNESRGKPNLFGHFGRRSPDDFRLRSKPAPSLFGNFRKPGREAAKRARASPARQGRPDDRRAAALRSQADMRLLSRALRAAQGHRAAALSPRSLRAAPAGWRLAGRRWLSARPSLEQLFAEPSLRRLLEARSRDEGVAAPQLAARVRLLRDKERELRDTRELARGAERAARRGCSVYVTSPGSHPRGGGRRAVHLHTPTRLGGRPRKVGRRQARGTAHLPGWWLRAGAAPHWRESGARVTARGVAVTHVSPAGAQGGLLRPSGGKQTARAEIGGTSEWGKYFRRRGKC